MTHAGLTWALVLALAAISFITRASFIVPGGRARLPPSIERILRFAPAAALMAIVLPDITRVHGVVSLSFDNPRLVAGAVAFLVAALTRSILLTIVAGLGVLALMGTS